jgi:hypothetical protein
MSKGKIMDLAHVARSLASVPSRRNLLRALAGSSLAAAASWRLRSRGVAARDHHGQKRRNNRKNKQQRTKIPLPVNRFGCLDVGQPCRGNSANCCSGICQGGRPKKGRPDSSVCVAHDAIGCTPEMDICSSDVATPCNPSNPGAFCTLTTGNAGYCADLPLTTAGATSGDCRTCGRDTDCQAEFGPGSACVVFGGACAGACDATGGTACVQPGA